MEFFDVRVFNPNARRCAKQELSKTYQLNEKETKYLHNKQITHVKHDTFTPLMMYANGGRRQELSKFYLRLSDLISEKRESIYSIVAT